MITTTTNNIIIIKHIHIRAHIIPIYRIFTVLHWKQYSNKMILLSKRLINNSIIYICITQMFGLGEIFAMFLK